VAAAERIQQLVKLPRRSGNEESIKICLSSVFHALVMRVAMAMVVALLILNFADEHFNNARYTRAAAVIISQIVRSFG
jgi:hypothetical protein